MLGVGSSSEVTFLQPIELWCSMETAFSFPLPREFPRNASACRTGKARFVTNKLEAHSFVRERAGLRIAVEIENSNIESSESDLMPNVTRSNKASSSGGNIMQRSGGPRPSEDTPAWDLARVVWEQGTTTDASSSSQGERGMIEIEIKSSVKCRSKQTIR